MKMFSCWTNDSRPSSLAEPGQLLADRVGREVGRQERLHHQREPRPVDPGVEVDDVHAHPRQAARDPVDVAGVVVAEDGEDEPLAVGHRRPDAFLPPRHHRHGQAERPPTLADRRGHHLGRLVGVELHGQDDREVPPHDRLAQLDDVPPEVAERPRHRLDDPHRIRRRHRHDIRMHVPPTNPGEADRPFDRPSIRPGALDRRGQAAPGLTEPPPGRPRRRPCPGAGPAGGSASPGSRGR